MLLFEFTSVCGMCAEGWGPSIIHWDTTRNGLNRQPDEPKRGLTNFIDDAVTGDYDISFPLAGEKTATNFRGAYW